MSASLPIPDEVIDLIAARVADMIADHFEPPKQWPEWMSVSTAALYLDCPSGRLYKLAQRDQIPHLREGGRLFFARVQLDEWRHAAQNRRQDVG